jgi:hypothetical protein
MRKIANELVECLYVDIDFLDISEEGHVLPRAFLVPATVYNVLSPEILRKVGRVSELRTWLPATNALVVDERDVVALDVPPCPVY